MSAGRRPPASECRHLKTLDVRRHAQRADGSDEDSALSQDGRAAAEMLAREKPPYALVVATPLRRAQETARLIGGRLDASVPELLPDLGAALGSERYALMRVLADWTAFVRYDARAQDLADGQLRVWAGLAARVGEGQSVLAVSHGGTIEIPAAALAARLRNAFTGPSFGYCEGVRVRFERGEAVALEVLRA